VKYAVAEGDMLVHARSEWPCLVCRPSGQVEAIGSFLCVDCAHDIISSSVSELGEQSRHWQDVGYALAELLEQAQDLERLAVN
jgi:hypothetical protein